MALANSFNFNMRQLLAASILTTILTSYSKGQPPVLSSLPPNATVVKGNSVLLDCPLLSEYAGSFTWRFFGATVVGQQIYSTPPYSPSSDPKFSPDRFQKVGLFGLNISDLRWQDGGTYQCNFVFGDVSGLADIIVIDTLEAKILPSEVAVGDEVTLTCSATFGAPLNDSDHVTASQFPQVSMTYIDDFAKTIQTPFVYSAGQPNVRQHVITLTKRYTVTSPATTQYLNCSVFTLNPSFSYSMRAVLRVKVPAYNVRVSPEDWERRVNDVINCSADGVPSPTYTWVRVDSTSSVDSFKGPLLTITSDMVGNNTWKCAAANELNVEPATHVISFNVFGTGAAVEVSSASSSVGLVVGLTLGIAGAIVITVILVVLIVKRRHRAGQVKEKKKPQPKEREMQPMSGGGNPDVDYRPLGADDSMSDIKPVPKPRTLSANTTLDVSVSGSGYPDLVGIGMMKAAGSMESLNRSIDESDPGGRTRPKDRLRQRNPRGSTESLDKSLDKPKPTDRSRMTGSNESLDQIGADGRPKPKERPRTVESGADTKPLLKDRPPPPQADLYGSNESLDKLQPTAKPRPNLRASQESLDKIVAAAGGGGKAAAPPTAPKPTKKSDSSYDDGGRRGGEALRSGTLSSDSSIV